MIVLLSMNECLIVMSAVFFMQLTLTRLSYSIRRGCVLSYVVDKCASVCALNYGKWRLLLCLGVNECIDVFTCCPVLIEKGV